MYHSFKTKTISLFMSALLLLAPSGVLATETGKVASLKEGQPAPYSGVLFDETFAARLIAEEEHKQIECNLKIKFELEKMEAKHALEMGNVKATLDSLRSQHSALINIKEDEIKRLHTLALKNPNDNANLWFGGGVAVGIITSIIIFYAAVEVQK